MPSSNNASLIIIKLNKIFFVVIKGILEETMALEMIPNIIQVCVAKRIHSELSLDEENDHFVMLKFV